MDFDAKIDLRSDRLTQPANIVDRAFDLRGMGLVVWFVFAFVQQRIEVTKRGEAGLFQSDGFFHEFLDRAALHVAVKPGLVTHFAAKQLVDRNVEELALDVPQRDVDRRHRAGDRAAGEMIGAQHHIPVMLDRERVLADEIVAVFGDRCGGCLQLAPGARLADADDARYRYGRAHKGTDPTAAVRLW